MKLPLAIIIGVLLPGSLAAQECPPAHDTGPATAEIYTQLQFAETEATARALTDTLWKIWHKAPDPKAQLLLEKGLSAFQSRAFDRARSAYDELIFYCPNYAEGYNQRAFVSYVRQDFGAALDDLERALELDPNHVAAMAGQALTLMRLGRMEAGQNVLRNALKLHPWLPERRYLLESSEPADSDL